MVQYCNCAGTVLVLSWYCSGIVRALCRYCGGSSSALLWHCAGTARLLQHNWHDTSIAQALCWRCTGRVLVLGWYCWGPKDSASARQAAGTTVRPDSYLQGPVRSKVAPPCKALDECWPDRHGTYMETLKMFPASSSALGVRTRGRPKSRRPRSGQVQLTDNTRVLSDGGHR